MSVSWPRDRGTLLTGAALLAVTVAAWIGVLGQSRMGESMQMAPPSQKLAMDGMGAASPWLSLSAEAGLAYVAAWLVMMAAMMLPSAAPMVLLYRRVAAGQAARGGAALLTALFVGGYLLVWGAIGLLLYLTNTLLALAAAASVGLAAALPYGTAAVLAIAGLYQLTPLKEVCLRQCRSPLDFLMVRWRKGVPRALELGIDHGLYCLGCCWGLMAVLVAAGAMGLAWVGLIALVVFVEKLLPRGETTARLVGLLLLGLGVAVALRPELIPLLTNINISEGM